MHAKLFPVLLIVGLGTGIGLWDGRAAPGAEGAAGKKKIVLLAGPASHGWCAHAHPAGCLLLARWLEENVPQVEAVVHKGWPHDAATLSGAASIVIYCDDNGLIGPEAHYQALDALVRKGTGLVFLHYALDVGSQERGRHLLDWIGGYYEQYWSVNPTWTAHFAALPEHPVARGVRPFVLLDEWYYHMRFREGMQGVTPILTATPPDHTRQGPDGPHSGNPVVRLRRGMAEHVAWAYQRPGGGRGFGLTGGHFHWNWAHDDFRKVVLNAIVWTAGIEVPPDGVPSRAPTAEELEANQDFPRPADWTRQTTLDTLKKLRGQ
jgi:type 1 glutamine amidotransferase